MSNSALFHPIRWEYEFKTFWHYSGLSRIRHAVSKFQYRFAYELEAFKAYAYQPELYISIRSQQLPQFLQHPLLMRHAVPVAATFSLLFMIFQPTLISAKPSDASFKAKSSVEMSEHVNTAKADCCERAWTMTTMGAEYLCKKGGETVHENAPVDTTPSEANAAVAPAPSHAELRSLIERLESDVANNQKLFDGVPSIIPSFARNNPSQEIQKTMSLLNEGVATCDTNRELKLQVTDPRPEASQPIVQASKTEPLPHIMAVQAEPMTSSATTSGAQPHLKRITMTIPSNLHTLAVAQQQLAQQRNNPNQDRVIEFSNEFDQQAIVNKIQDQQLTPTEFNATTSINERQRVVLTVPVRQNTNEIQPVATTQKEDGFAMMAQNEKTLEQSGSDSAVSNISTSQAKAKQPKIEAEERSVIGKLQHLLSK